jgi:Leucine-rich repeat (LRR) protein
MIDGENWLWKDEATYGPKWNFSDTVDLNPCSSDENGIRMAWQGLVCSNSPIICQNTSCHIYSLLLNKYGLSGSLPSELSLLTSLTKLDLSESSLTNSLPLTLSRLTSLQSLLLQTNHLSHTLPSSLAALTQLTNFKVADNYFTGSIPSSYGSLTRLNVLQFTDNYFTSSIPSELTALVQLQYFYAQDNHLTGPLPSGLGSLNRVWYLYLQQNDLTGSIPPSLGDMSSLLVFSFDNNHLSGPLPSSIGSLTQLQYLYLQVNALSHALPSSIGLLTSLVFCAIDYNALTGPLPSSLGSLRRLQYLYLRSNSLSSTLPPELSGMTRLGTLSLHMNQLTGSIPSSLGETMSSLQYLSLYSNLLTGSLPSSLSKIRSLYSLALEANDLSGTIPPEFGAFSRLIYLTLNLNRLSGSIPPDLGNITSLNFVNFRSNKLTGPLPPHLFEGASQLVSLSLQSNSLTGSLPSQLGFLTKLTELYLQDNHLSQGLQNLFWKSPSSSSSLRSLMILDLSHNLLEGTLPSSLFSLPHLQIIALTSNCFHGTLPSSLCQSNTGKIFYLDGLGLGSSCPHHTDTVTVISKILFPFTKIPLLNSMEGDIPACLWNLTNLEVLSLSGNGLSGTLADLSPQSHLINVTLSHNHLSGTIPLSFLSWPFHTLDLSYNKLIGTCEEMTIPAQYPGEYSNSSRVTLAVNRLSGRLPLLVRDYHASNILEGNLFGCSNIPPQDKTSQSYICGSIEFDQSLYTLTALLSTALLTFLTLWWIHTSRGSGHHQNPYFFELRHHLIRCYHSIACHEITPQQLPRLFSFSKALESVAKISLVIMSLGCLLCLPIYVLKARDNGELLPEYSTHSYLYRWLWTTAYAKSELIAGMLMAAWAVSILLFVSLLSLWLTNPSSNNLSRPASLASSSPSSSTNDPFQTFILSLMAVSQFTLMDATQLLTLTLLNLFVVGGVNAVYIIAVFRELSPDQHLLVQLAMASFKYFWNFVCVPWLILGPLKNTRYKASLRLVFMLLNSVWVPFVVTALTSPLCFRHLLILPHEIDSTYTYLTCDTVLYGVCIEWEPYSVEVIPLTPSFSYDYLCASSIITVYVPVFIYTACLQILLPTLSTYLLVGSGVYEMIPMRWRSSFDGVLWPHAWRETDITRLSERNLFVGLQEGPEGDVGVGGEGERNLSSPTQDLSSEELPSPDRLLNVQTIVATLMHQITVLLTFGLCCPALALAVTCSICVSVLQWRYLVGRFVSSRLISRTSVRMVMSSPRVVDGVLITLELSVGNALDYFRATLWPVLWTSCLFFVFVCWDMAGDRVGWRAAIWAPYTAIAFSIFIWLLMRARKNYWLTRGGERGEGEGQSLEIEKIQNPIREEGEGEKRIGQRQGENDRHEIDDPLRESNQTIGSFQIESSISVTPSAGAGGVMRSILPKLSRQSGHYSETSDDLKTVNLGSSC